MKRISDKPVAIPPAQSDVWDRAGRSGKEQKRSNAMTENRMTRQQQMQDLVEWKLKSDVEYTRKAIIERARWLAVRLTSLADGLEQDVEYSFNTIGELQGNGVELDTWCTKLGFARETLKLVRQAMAGEDEA